MVDENRVILFGEVKKYKNVDIFVLYKNRDVRVFLTKNFMYLQDILSKELSNGVTLYCKVHGLIAHMNDYDYIYPYNITLTKVRQEECANVYFEGLVVNQYVYDNRIRLFVTSSRGGKNTKTFITIFREKDKIYPNFSGRKALFVGRLDPNKNRLHMVADKFYFSEEDVTKSYVVQENLDTNPDKKEEEDIFSNDVFIF